ncbi:MAG: Asp-tRNA(Asn)/Glu-tRNA(Gln) amidotransferase GatCAB subunit B, partial [Anaerolineaceae bacterium]
RKMRSKETEADYRYFREPDLLPVVLTPEQIEQIKANLPELPLERKQRFVEEYQLSVYDAEILTNERSLSDYYEETVRLYGGEAKTVSNWMMNDLSRLMNDLGKNAAQLQLQPADLAKILGLIDAGKISSATGKLLLKKVEESGKSPKELVEAEGLGLIGDEDSLREQIKAVLTEAPNEVANFKAGKESLMGWFLGQVMRRTGGKADPKRTRELLQELLR